MKNYFLIILFIICASFKAQESIIKIDSATGGRLVIRTDASILAMINEKEICKNPATTSSKIPTTSPERGGNPKTYTSPKGRCGKRNDIPGYMIKVGEAKSEADINTLMSKFRSEFPELRVEKNYLRPDWRLLAGDFFTRESGQGDLRRIKRSFPVAHLINWRIYCNRAK